MAQKFSVRGVDFFVPKDSLSCTTESWISEEVLDRDLDFFKVVHDFLNAPCAYNADGCIEFIFDQVDSEVTLKCVDGSVLKGCPGILQVPRNQHRVVELLCPEPCPVKEVRLVDGAEMQALGWKAVTDGEGTILFLQDAVPVYDFRLQDRWLEADKERLFWQEMNFYQIFPLEMSMWSAILQKLLKVYIVYSKEGGQPHFQSWPGRDRHQLWASLWLALRFLAHRSYSSVELRWMVAYHLEEPKLSLINAVQSELFRRGFLEECTDGVQLSISGVKWVLNGDKFFRSRKADAVAGQVWWQLPLNTQHVLLSNGPVAGDTTPLLSKECGPTVCGFSAYRVVFLAMNFTDEDLQDYADKVSCHFRHREGPAATSCRWGVLTETSKRVPFVHHTLLEDVICVECDVASEARLPPLRIDGCRNASGEEWLVLACQAMPTTEEICSHGRNAARCFLPRAVPVVEEASPRADEFARAREALEAQLVNFMAEALPRRRKRLRQWPSKGKAQGWAARWLILHFEAGRCYSELEVDWIIATHHNLAAKVPDCARIRKDLERTGFICRGAGGGGFQLKSDTVEQLLARG